MKIAVVGGGICGLTCAYCLSKEGHKVWVLEKKNSLGGLAGSFTTKDWQWPLENYYHHFFPSDKELLSLLKDLGLQNKLFFKTPKTSIFIKGSVHPFDTPLAVLFFPLLNFTEKVRVGLATTFLKLTPFWQSLEKVSAHDWLKKYYGKRAYKILWEPLLKAKFAQSYSKVPASWFWARIKKRSNRLGYLEGGTTTLVNALATQIKNNSGKILLGVEIKRLDDVYRLSKFDKIIITTSPEVFLKIAPNLPKDYAVKLKNLKSIGAIILVLTLKKQFLNDHTYWLNINDEGFPFVAVVEHTNFIDSEHYGDNHLLYVGGYYPVNHPFFKMTKEQIYQKFLPFLTKINSKFNFQLCTLNFELHTELYAQPVIPLHYSKQVPSLATPIPNVFLATMHHIYPWDRGVNYAIKLGRQVADEIEKT